MSCGYAIGNTSFLFIVWGLINDVISIKLSWFIMDIVHYLLIGMKLTWFPPHMWWTAYHVVDIDIRFLVSLFTIGACLSGVDVDEFVSMGSEIYHWIQVCFIYISPQIWFLFCGFSNCTCVGYHNMLNEACGGGGLSKQLYCSIPGILQLLQVAP